MLIETSGPRQMLVECIVDSLCDTLNDRHISLISYLKELAMVIEYKAFPSDCIVLKGGQHIVLIPDFYEEDDIIEIIARIRLRHVRYYDYYGEDLRKILDEEVRLFRKRYIVKSNNLVLEAAVFGT